MVKFKNLTKPVLIACINHWEPSTGGRLNGLSRFVLMKWFVFALNAREADDMPDAADIREIDNFCDYTALRYTGMGSRLQDPLSKRMDVEIL